jgi:RNA polymerase sigma-70 factor, ECF subfamily
MIDARRLKDRDEFAWEALHAAHHTVVFRLAYLMLGNPGDADDAAQDTFLRAYRAAHTLDATRDARPWLLGICANVCRNQRRSARRFLAMLQRAAFAQPELVEPMDGPEAGAEAALRAAVLWRAVRRLPLAQQEVVYLRYFLSQGEAEAALALGVPAGTVKSRAHRALNSLRNVIDRDFPELRESDAAQGSDSGR